MGQYLEVPENFDKAQQLIDLHGASLTRVMPFDQVPKDRMLICVVENALFEAAGVVYSQREWDEFTHEDGRPRIWLLMDKDTVLEMNPAVKDKLAD